MGRALARSRMRKKSGWTAGDLHDVGLPLVAHDGVEHPLDLREGAVLLAIRSALGVTDRTREVAGVADLHE